MGNDLHDLGHEGLVRRDLVVPLLHKFPQYDGDDGVELEIDIVAAGQRRQ
jgi:hypothetical protein